jgi:hypothetical protein
MSRFDKLSAWNRERHAMLVTAFEPPGTRRWKAPFTGRQECLPYSGCRVWHGEECVKILSGSGRAEARTTYRFRAINVAASRTAANITRLVLRAEKHTVMKTRFCLLAVLVLAAGAGAPARGEVVVSVFGIEDSRAIEFANDGVSRTQQGTKVVLSLRGPEAESGTRYGDIKITEAVDDQGTSLIPSKDKNPFYDPAKFKDYDNAFFRKSKFGNAKAADPQVELTLAQPKRAATKIARLRGTLTISDQGTVQTVELGHLPGAGKKALAMPDGAGVGVTVTVAAGDKVKEIGLEITGDEAALESIEVVDAAGKEVSGGMSSWSMNGGPAHKSLDLNRPLDDSMKLVAKVSLNRKLTVVPFDLKDIPLP